VVKHLTHSSFWPAFGHVHLQTMQKVVFIREAITEDVANNMIALTL
jgi:hypothetical protein